MKILFVSDLHLDAITAGVRRIRELERSVNHVVERAITKKANVFIFGGDLCDPDSGSIVFECMRIAIEAAHRLASEGIISYWVAGNHDVKEDGSGTTTLAPLKGASSPLVRVIETGAIFSIGNVDFCFLPFTASSHPYDASEFVTKHLNGSSNPLVVVSHLHVRGMIPGEETLDMPRGRAVYLPDAEIFEKRFGGKAKRKTIVLQGHYHRGGVYTAPSGLEVNVPGSLGRLRFGPEESVEPAYLWVEV